MNNIPKVRLGITAVSRDCFPLTLSVERRKAVVKACAEKGLEIVEIQTAVENEKDVLKALDELKSANVNALVVYLGNFGPEGPETLLAKFGDRHVCSASVSLKMAL
jgi:L-fucose isomerase-like protein